MLQRTSEFVLRYFEFHLKKYFIFSCVYVWGRAGSCLLMSAEPTEARGVWSPGAVIWNYFESPNMATGNWTLLFWDMLFFSVEPYTQHQEEFILFYEIEK